MIKESKGADAHGEHCNVIYADIQLLHFSERLPAWLKKRNTDVNRRGSREQEAAVPFLKAAIYRQTLFGFYLFSVLNRSPGCSCKKKKKCSPFFTAVDIYT